ncbi:MAG: hypothetical protein HY331_13525 [Chloroflexi bacterium]|nr:hypothetical protein [Chloroflexota bacterium]
MAERDWLLEQAGQALREAEALQGIAAEVAVEVDLDRLLDLIATRTQEVLAADLALIALRERGAGGVVVRAASGNGGEGLVGRRLPPGVPPMVGPTVTVPQAALAELGVLPDGLAAPLAQAERHLGVLVALRPTVAEPARRLGLVAEIVASAVERAILARALSLSERQYRLLVESAQRPHRRARFGGALHVRQPGGL